MALNDDAVDVLNSTASIAQGILVGTAIVAIPLLLLAVTTSFVSSGIIKFPMQRIQGLVN